MCACVISHLIGLQVGCSGTIIENLSSYVTRIIPVLSCRWSFDICLEGLRKTTKHLKLGGATGKIGKRSTSRAQILHLHQPAQWHMTRIGEMRNKHKNESKHQQYCNRHVDGNRDVWLSKHIRCEDMGCINLDEDRIEWRVLVDTAMNLPVSYDRKSLDWTT
jgi:hypothetical protein